MKPFYPAPSIRLAEVVRTGLPALEAKHGMHLNQDQRQALRAIEHCRTPRSGRDAGGLHGLHPPPATSTLL